MSTIREMQYDVGQKILAVKKEGVKVIREKLEELNLGGLVRRRRDGVIGELSVREFNDIRFYPLKKNGLPSERASGNVWNLEKEFESANKVEE